MKAFILAILISIAFQGYAGELIFLDNYGLEKSGNEFPSVGTEHKRERGPVKLESEGSNAGAERGREREWGRERRERDPNTQVETNERRNIEDYTIRKIKGKREIDDAIDDSPLLEYQF